MFCPDLLRDSHTLFGGNGSLTRLPELLNHTGITPEILFATDKDDGETSAEVHYFRDPLFLDVIEGIRRVYSEADEDDVGVWITEGPETIVIFLASGIPKGELDVLSVDFHVCDVVLEHCRHVDFGESSFGEYNQKAGLATSTITNDDQLPSDFRHIVWGEDEGYSRRMGSDDGGDSDERELARWCWLEQIGRAHV